MTAIGCSRLPERGEVWQSLLTEERVEVVVSGKCADLAKLPLQKWIAEDAGFWERADSVAKVAKPTGDPLATYREWRRPMVALTDSILLSAVRFACLEGPLIAREDPDWDGPLWVSAASGYIVLLEEAEKTAPRQTLGQGKLDFEKLARASGSCFGAKECGLEELRFLSRRIDYASCLRIGTGGGFSSDRAVRWMDSVAALGLRGYPTLADFDQRASDSTAAAAQIDCDVETESVCVWITGNRCEGSEQFSRGWKRVR